MTGPDIAGYAAKVELPDQAARAAAAEQLGRRGRPLGRLGDLAVWLAGCQGSFPPKPITHPRLLIFAADHGIAAAGVSAQPAGATAARARLIAVGGDAAGALAAELGVPVEVVDVGIAGEAGGHVDGAYKVRRGSGRIDREDALTDDEALAAFEAGARIADAAVDSGADLLLTGTIGVAATTAAAALTGVLTGSDAAVVTGRGSGVDDRAWMRKCAAVRDAMRRARPVVSDRLRLLAVAGGADLAAMTGFLLQAAVRRTPVVLDDVTVSASALVAQRIAYRAPEWWIAGQSTAEPAHQRALDRLALTTATDLGTNLGAGVGALLCLPALRAAAVLLAVISEDAAYGEVSGVVAGTDAGSVSLTHTADGGNPPEADVNGHREP
jgi:nicotinate-nucleotide--dimethylbenzimidazole phosphoribosyltransferase